MRAGKLARHRLILEKPEHSQTPSGDVQERWVKVDVIPAGVRVLSGREIARLDMQEAIATHIIEFRYVQCISPSYRFRDCDGDVDKIYNITAVGDPHGKKREMRAFATELV